MEPTVLESTASSAALAIAQRLTGRQSDDLILHTTSVLSGGAHLGCFIHEARTGSAVLKFVEKHSRSTREIAFAVEFVRLYSSLECPIAPNIYATERRDGYTAIFMEYLDGTAVRFAATDENAVVLGRSIAALYQPETAGLTPSLLNSHLANLAKFEGCAKDDNFASDELSIVSAVVRTLSQLRTRADRLLMVPCHNDVNFANIAYTPARIRFIDWGQFSLNMAGSDFHHFITAGAFRADLRAFTEKAIEEYTASMRLRDVQIAIEDARFAAHYYSLVRTVSRYVTRRDHETFARTIKLYEHLKQVMDR